MQVQAKVTLKVTNQKCLLFLVQFRLLSGHRLGNSFWEMVLKDGFGLLLHTFYYFIYAHGKI